MQLRAGAEHIIELAHLAVVHEIEIELDRVAQVLRLVFAMTAAVAP
jgi:hypothetical protein